MRARIGVSAAVLAATILVAACSGDEDEPSSLPDATTAGSAVTPTDTGSTPPADPTAHLEAEITDFYKLYVETINESWTSEHALQRRREMFADTCVECLAGYEFARKAHSDNLTLLGGIPHVTEVRVDAVNGDVVTFLTLSKVPAARLADPQGTVVMQFEEGPNTQTVYQAQQTESGSWIIISGQTLS
jgi:hypothetical protein